MSTQPVPTFPLVKGLEDYSEFTLSPEMVNEFITLLVDPIWTEELERDIISTVSANTRTDFDNNEYAIMSGTENEDLMEVLEYIYKTFEINTELDLVTRAKAWYLGPILLSMPVLTK